MFRCAEKLRACLARMPEAGRARVDAETGRWRAPEFSARVVAALRAAARANGLEWTHDAPRGVEKYAVVGRVRKGHKWERERANLEARRAEALAKQPELIAAHRARMKTKAKGLDKVWDDFILTKSERTLKLRAQDEQGGRK